MSQTKIEDFIVQPVSTPRRPPTPPYLSQAARGVSTPQWSAFKVPHEHKMIHLQSFKHCAWSADGKKIAAVGIDKVVRVWSSEDITHRSTQVYNGHSDEVDYVIWNPAHTELMCSSSQREKRVIFWDTRQNRPSQSVNLRYGAVQLDYAPDGRTIMYTSAGGQLGFLAAVRGEDGKDQWKILEKDQQLPASIGLFNHAGDGIVAAHSNEYTLRLFDYPSLQKRDSVAAHIGGCIAIALDPRGRYLASGGQDSIVNLFDLSTMLCASTITCCEHQITALSFSADGEYIAIASTGNYIDICATETGAQMHRITTTLPVQCIAWHPSSLCLAFCGYTNWPAPSGAIISIFGTV